MDKTMQSLCDAGIHPSVVREGVNTSINPLAAIDLVNVFMVELGNTKIPDAIMGMIGYFHPVTHPPSQIAAPSEEDARLHLIAAGIDQSFLAHEEVSDGPAMVHQSKTILNWLETLLAAAAKYGPGVFDTVWTLLDALKKNFPSEGKVEDVYEEHTDPKTDHENRERVEEQTRAQNPHEAFDRAKENEPTQKEDYGHPLTPTPIKPVK